MEWVRYFILQNFILLCTSVIVIVNTFQHYKQDKKVSLYSSLIIGVTLLIAIFITLEQYARSIVSVPLTTVFSVLGYVLRPALLYLFLLMSYERKKTKLFWVISALPLLINLIIFVFAFVPGTKEYVVFYHINEQGNIAFGGGFLRYSSHIVAGIYLIYLVYLAISRLRQKHISNGIAIMFCALFVVFAVIIETFFNDKGDIFVLNATIGLSVLTYFVFAYMERMQLDALTGVYNRGTYYHDLPRMEKSLSGVIQCDLNGLKYLNDNKGHDEGDKALVTVSKAILDCSHAHMYAYRMGGDEFLILVNGSDEEVLIETVKAMKAFLAETPYTCSIGYAYRKDPSVPAVEVVKEAERKMYEDKESFYENSSLERRRGRKG